MFKVKKVEKLTTQEAFNIMVRHMMRQGCRSYDQNLKMCRYRGPNGAMCAVGAIIPNKLYTTEMEGKTILMLLYYFDKFPKVCNFLSVVDKYFLAQMQNIHDDVDIDMWEEKFKEVAYNFNLVMPNS